MGVDKNIILSSVGSNKMEGITQINTNPLTNPTCEKLSKIEGIICNKCYSRPMMKMRKACNPRFTNNGNILSSGEIYEKDIEDLSKAKYIRFHSHGELLNKQHLENFYKIADMYSEKSFSLFTKRIDLVWNSDKQIPENVVMVFSNYRVDNKLNKVPRKFDKVFSVFTKDYAIKKDLEINCHGKCITCLKCYTNNDVEFVNEIIKSHQKGYYKFINNL